MLDHSGPVRQFVEPARSFCGSHFVGHIEGPDIVGKAALVEVSRGYGGDPGDQIGFQNGDFPEQVVRWLLHRFLDCYNDEGSVA